MHANWIGISNYKWISTIWVLACQTQTEIDFSPLDCLLCDHKERQRVILPVLKSKISGKCYSSEKENKRIE